MIVVAGQRLEAVVGEHQIERRHAGEVHADDAGPEHQAGGVFEQLMKRTAAIAQMTGNQQRGEAGANGDHDREGEQHGLVIGRRIRAHGGHADVMHDRDAQADPHRGPQVLPEIQLRMAEGVHRQPRGYQCEQQ